MTQPLPNYTEYTTEDLTALIEDASRERDRRAIVENAERQIDSILAGVQSALGREPGDQWVQPLGAHDAYPTGAEVSYDGKRWTSILSANVWPPGVSGWRLVVDPNAVADWIQPTGYQDAYPKGSKVAYGGQTWTSTIDDNVWAPGVYGWEVTAS